MLIQPSSCFDISSSGDPVSLFKQELRAEPGAGSDGRRVADRLVEHAEALLDLAHALDGAEAVDELSPDALSRHVLAPDAVPDADWGRLAERLYRERRMRDRVFADEALFGEPAWDLLLDLTASELRGRKLSVTSACIGACVPSTTALRWISILEQRGLVVRESDARDRRRAFVRISPDGFRKMVTYLGGLERGDCG